MSIQKITPVILSGGIGSRLWPLSRRQRPKQFIALATGKTLFEDTLSRVDNAALFDRPLIVCAQDHRFLVRDILEQSGHEAQRILMEPCLRNTAPAIAAAAFEAQKQDPESLLLVLPSDHFIPDTAAFEKAVEMAAAQAAKGGYVLFGIKPSGPHTGYGYIQFEQGTGVCAIKSFREKPDAATAAKYLEQGGYVWNSGMFLLNAKDFLEELKTLQPEIYNAVEAAHKNAVDDLGDLLLDEAPFKEAPNISIDFGIMEKTDKGVILPVSFEWSDLGAWDSLWEISDKDGQGNALHGDVVARDTRNSYLRAEGAALICTSGIEDIAVIATDDVIVVTKRGQAGQVGELMNLMDKQGRTEATEARQVFRPWGSYETLSESPGYKTKRIIVKPGRRLSLQKHARRAEHWVVVQGTARVTLDNEVFDLQENQSTYIPSGTVHRLENAQEKDLILIEVQTGAYLGEDDIIRLEDDFGRRQIKAKAS